jgi:hypothetical protein
LDQPKSAQVPSMGIIPGGTNGRYFEELTRNIRDPTVGLRISLQIHMLIFYAFQSMLNPRRL